MQSTNYGFWNSRISSSSISQNNRLNEVKYDSVTSSIVWSESRPNGSFLVTQHDSEAICDLTDGTIRVGGSVGYAGGDFDVYGGKVVFVSKDGCIWLLDLVTRDLKKLNDIPLSCASPKISNDGNYACFVVSKDDVDGIALVDLRETELPIKIIYHDSDFVTQPVWSHDSRYIAFVAWNHPNMHWDHSFLVEVDTMLMKNPSSSLSSSSVIVFDNEKAVFQPTYIYEDDSSGDSPESRRILLATENDQDEWCFVELCCRRGIKWEVVRFLNSRLGNVAFPAWIQGMRSYVLSSNNKSIFAIASHHGADALIHLDANSSSKMIPFSGGYTSLTQICRSIDRIFMIASSDRIPPRIISIKATSSEDEQTPIIHRRSTTECNIPYLTQTVPGRAISWKTTGGIDCHGLLFEPSNPEIAKAKSSPVPPPPLIVNIHGGPTHCRKLEYNEEIKYFTTRGFCVLAVNHRGSSGYGRKYRNLLRYQWGVVDVEDAKTGSEYCVSKGLVDKDRIAIMGGSAGGTTVLLSLVKYPHFYTAAIANYPVCDHIACAKETHKFERFYNDFLLGKLENNEQVWRERSPLHVASGISDNLALFHGDSDEVVPVNQSKELSNNLKERNIHHLFHVFEGEGHGWRKPANISFWLDSVLEFLREHLKL